MTISNDVIEKIRLSTDIAEIVREYVPTMKKAGRNWKALCPFHNEKTPSFMVSPEKGIFHCFGCHAGGDVFKFVALADNISWPEAVKKLAGKAGITVLETKDEVVKRSEKQKIYDVLESAADFYYRSLIESRDLAASARKYLKERGVNQESLEKFKIGFAPKGALISAAAKKGHSPEELIRAGLVTKTERGNLYEYMSERIVFPIFDTHGRVVAFGGRTLKDEQPKYLNTPETSVYSKSNHLYGLFQSLSTLRHDKTAIVLEGYMDVILTHQYGVRNTVASLGTAFTQQHSHILNRYADKLTLLFDADQAGKNAAKRTVEIFLDTDLVVDVVNLPDNTDPDEFVIKDGREKLIAFIEKNKKSGYEYLTETAITSNGKDKPEQKAGVVSELLPYLSKVHNAVIKHEWIRHIAGKLKINEDSVKQELDIFEGKQKRFIKKTDVSFSIPVRSAEEEIIQILAAHPQFLRCICENDFRMERGRKIFKLLSSNVAVSQIVEHLDEDSQAWFTELLLEEKNYDSPEQTINNILKDISSYSLESERRLLEKEVILMIDGQKPLDPAKMQHYHDLTKQLKGSAKAAC